VILSFLCQEGDDVPNRIGPPCQTSYPAEESIRLPKTPGKDLVRSQFSQVGVDGIGM
jgi:hypothetical protein